MQKRIKLSYICTETGPDADYYAPGTIDIEILIETIIQMRICFWRTIQRHIRQSSGACVTSLFYKSENCIVHLFYCHNTTRTSSASCYAHVLCLGDVCSLKYICIYIAHLCKQAPLSSYVILLSKRKHFFLVKRAAERCYQW